MKTLFVVIFCVLLVSFCADGAFKAGKRLQQQHERTQELLRKLT